MRVADSVITGTLANNLNRSQERLNRFQIQLATGTRINDPSDDPRGASRALMLASDIRNVEQFKRNIDEGQGFMNFVDSVLDGMVNILIKVRGTAIQGASDTVNQNDRVILSREVDELLEQVLSDAQAKFRGRFVFAGTETLQNPYTAVRDEDGMVTTVGNSIRRSATFSDTTTAIGTLLSLSAPPSGTVTIGDQTVALDLATDSLSDIKTKIETAAPTGVTVDIQESVSSGISSFRLKINGTTTIADSNNVLGIMSIGSVDTTGKILREVDDGIRVQINVEGRELFEGAQNAFSGMLNLRNSLANNDINGIRESITDIETLREKISNARGVLGARSRRVELTRELLSRFEVDLSKALSDIEDTNITDTIINLQSEQQVFQAALATGATVFQPTLLDFLR